MKKIILGVFLCISTATFAQKIPENAENRDKIEAAKIALLTNNLNLSQEQAGSFWIVYKEWDLKRDAGRKNAKKMMEEASALATSEARAEQIYRELFASRQKELDAEKEYFGKFRKVISMKQYASMIQTERTFHQMLLKQINKDK